jgi:hypothetical protein
VRVVEKVRAGEDVVELNLWSGLFSSAMPLILGGESAGPLVKEKKERARPLRFVNILGG